MNKPYREDKEAIHRGENPYFVPEREPGETGGRTASETTSKKKPGRQAETIRPAVPGGSSHHLEILRLSMREIAGSPYPPDEYVFGCGGKEMNCPCQR
ncbi:MAG: hypothetical protein LBB48_05605 [Treponema sp.]|nr:hypothetical protein [Treponema sp.]